MTCLQQSNLQCNFSDSEFSGVNLCMIRNEEDSIDDEMDLESELLVCPVSRRRKASRSNSTESNAESKSASHVQTRAMKRRSMNEISTSNSGNQLTQPTEVKRKHRVPTNEQEHLIETLFETILTNEAIAQANLHQTGQHSGQVRELSTLDEYSQLMEIVHDLPNTSPYKDIIVKLNDLLMNKLRMTMKRNAQSADKVVIGERRSEFRFPEETPAKPSNSQSAPGSGK